MDLPPASSALIVGCGDIGQRLARLLIADGTRVAGLVRTASSAETLEQQGVRALAADLDGDVAETFAKAATDLPDWLFWFAPPPPGEGRDDPRIRRGLAALPAPPRRLIYLSTTGVYGDCEGRWIDEEAPLAPASDRAHRRVDAENAARDYARQHGIEVLILRVPGIYGPGRLPVQRLRDGQPVLRADEAPPSNRIHADDLAAAARVVARSGTAGSAYNVSDGTPTTMTDYFLRCAALLGLPPPPQVDFAEARRRLSPMQMSFLDESKRLETSRLRALGWTPRYPDLASGLPACLAI